MPHGRIIIASVLAIAIASPLLPSPAQAQFPGGIFGRLTAPFRMLFRGGPHRHYGRLHRSQRALDRAVPATSAAAAAGIVAAVDRGRAHGDQAGAVNPGIWPSTSPSTYEDMLGYALWPRDYERQFWSRGPADIMQAMTAPTAASASVPGRHSRGRIPNRHAPGAPATATDRASCLAQTKERAVQPLDRASEALDLTEDQQQKLVALRSAVGEAIERESGLCRTQSPASQPERLQAMIDGLWAMRYATLHIRGALAAFYTSLDDAQKARLTEEPQTVGSSAPAAADGPAAVCGGQPPAGAATSNPFQPMEHSLRLTGEQQKSFRMLYGASIDMAKFLMSSCPAETPQTPVERLDAASDRIMSLVHAAMTIQPILNQFYANLSDDQRARFNTAAR